MRSRYEGESEDKVSQAAGISYIKAKKAKRILCHSADNSYEKLKVDNHL